jgi:hypothetical protein
MPRRSITIRFPAALVDDARKRAAPDESFNDLVVSALEHEARRRSALATLERINELRRRVWARAGEQPSSAPLIRQMREERIRRG